ncbi:MAG: flagellar biosynthesis anti-sigma factor FlgM [Polymorphobacter sp.]|uniref:flagellar biosynthesis anti-sigma factor FlgM n=1 Tax=Polymorphobacter sp. TaxID=1909290 RepID=UPI003A8A3845
MIEGVGRMQPVAPATAETNGRAGVPADVRAAGRPALGADAPADVSLQRLGREMAAEAPVDAAKVAALRAAIGAGSYVVDADAIADAMLRQAGA